MTEQEWLSCTDPRLMLEFLRGQAGDRKLRLFAVAVSRLLPVLYPPKMKSALMRGIQAAEEYADGILDDYQADKVLEEVGLATAVSGTHPLILTVWHSLSPNAAEVVHDIAETILPVAARGILLDLFGPLPFRPVNISASRLRWNNATIPQLAQVIYDERELPSGHFDTGKLAILGDALIEAGCTSEDILSHCRAPGPHVRGCWLVDLLLGKS